MAQGAGNEDFSGGREGKDALTRCEAFQPRTMRAGEELGLAGRAGGEAPIEFRLAGHGRERFGGGRKGLARRMEPCAVAAREALVLFEWAGWIEDQRRPGGCGAGEESHQ